MGALVLALVAGLAVAGAWWWRRADRTPLDDALARVPSGSLRIGFTDWARVRTQLDLDLGDTPDREAVEDLAQKAYDTDLAAAASIDGSAAALQEIYGFGPATAQWEAYAQSPDGAVMVLRPPEGTDFDVLGENLRRAGYDAPSGGGVEGTWRGGVDLVAGLDPTLTPELQYVALLPDQGLVVSSDAQAYASRAARVASGDGTPAEDKAGVADLAERLGQTSNALLWTGDFACEDLSMADAAQDAQQRAETLVDDAGGVNPLAGFAMGMGAQRRLRVVAHLEDEARAREDLEPRARLAVGEAPGRGAGSFSDDYVLERSRALGSDVVLDLRSRTADGFVISGLYDGPLVFASC